VADGQPATVIGVAESPAGRRLLVHVGAGPNDWEIVERGDDGSGTWPNVIQRIPAAALGASTVRLGLSVDGLRLMLSGPPSLRYAMRANVDAPFSVPIDMPGIPFNSTHVYTMTSDCGRVYFDVIGSVFFANQ